jgi:hypothetical protein
LQKGLSLSRNSSDSFDITRINGSPVVGLGRVADVNFAPDLPDWRADQLLAQAAPPVREQPAAPGTVTDQTQSGAQAPPETAKSHLEAVAQQKITSSKELDQFNKNMTALESRGLSQKELDGTYTNIARILEATGPTAARAKDMVHIGEQTMRNAAHPTDIDQGFHDTCNVTTVEVRTYSRTPSAAAKLVADVATTGSYVTADGTTIKIDSDSLKPDDESNSSGSVDRNRNLASQVFQVTAANIHWQRADTDPFGNYQTKGTLKFEQHNNKRSLMSQSPDTGERLINYGVHPAKELARGPALSCSELPDIENQITALNESGFVVENQIHGGANTVHVSSEQDLANVLKNIKHDAKGNKMPVVIRVHTGNEPFLSDQGGGFSRSRGVWHVVNVVDYDETTGKVTVDNQWGKSCDHVMKIKDLYTATLEPPNSYWQLLHEGMIDILLHHKNPWKEDPMWIH